MSDTSNNNVFNIFQNIQRDNFLLNYLLSQQGTIFFNIVQKNNFNFVNPSFNGLLPMINPSQTPSFAFNTTQQNLEDKTKQYFLDLNKTSSSNNNLFNIHNQMEFHPYSKKENFNSINLTDKIDPPNSNFTFTEEIRMNSLEKEKELDDNLNEIILEKISKKKSMKQNKKFECRYEGCQKKFDYKWILERHMNSHFCFRLFKCDSCYKAYKSKENLNLHVKNKHMGLKPYSCDYCESKFSHRNGKTYHERKIHLQILPFKCTKLDCEKSFASKSALNYHIKNQH